MSTCKLCGVESTPGDKVTDIVDGHYEDFCSWDHFHAYKNGKREELAAKEETLGQQEEAIDLSLLTRPELMHEAKEQGLDFEKTVTKNGLIDLLTSKEAPVQE